MYTRFNQQQFIKLSQDADAKKRIESYIKPKLEKRLLSSVSKKPFLKRMGLSGGELTMPDLLRSAINDDVRDVLYKVPKKVVMGEVKKPEGSFFSDPSGHAAYMAYQNAAPELNLVSLQSIQDNKGFDPSDKKEMKRRANRMLSDNLNSSITGYKRYLTPQNINRAAALGGILSGGIAGGNTFRSYGASTLGSLGGLTAGGLTSTGINRALDSYYGDSGAGGSLRRIALDTLIPSLGATAGGYYAGRATR